ncbi:hypothetical protein AB6A40_000612 [Gnathostoma spinigerum]|uniref:Bardet-Biedl syndrome 4 n=1 Tax=Gnathostoma spinigerum TaxID=75299 RepID=A0ABD6EAX0_9BILA
MYELALAQNRTNSNYLLHIGRLLVLLERYGKAAEILAESISLNPREIKAYYWTAMALYYSRVSKGYAEMAKEYLLSAPYTTKSIDALTFIAEICLEQKEYEAAIQSYRDALKLEPGNLDILSKLALLHLRISKEDMAFSLLGKALSYDPSHVPSILAVGSIIQLHGEFDVALNKYRIAAENCDYNSALWNNIGLCFFGKGKLVAAISCLKKANYLYPLDERILYNLGLVHCSMQQYASAYHFLSSAVSLRPNSPMTLMALAIVLTHLDDSKNARMAYECALSLQEGCNPQILINYAIFETKKGNAERAEAFYTRSGQLLLRDSTEMQLVKHAAESLGKVLSSRNDYDKPPTPSHESGDDPVEKEKLLHT